MMMEFDYAAMMDELKQSLGPEALEWQEDDFFSTLKVVPTVIPELFTMLRDQFDFNHLANLTAVDYAEEMEMIYHLTQVPGNRSLAIKSRIDRKQPRVASLSGIYPTANWQERETYDLMGVVFEGHPNLVRVLLPDDFQGHPLRKDFSRRPWTEVIADIKDGTASSNAAATAGSYFSNLEKQDLWTDQYVLNVGPQHPSTHGGAHIETLLDGEIIVDINVRLGYVHRSVEKISEMKTFTQFIPYTARLDYLAGCLSPLSYTQAVEKLLDIQPSERAEYIRVIMAEFSRISSHLLCIGSLALDLGSTTAMIYCVRDREQIMDMFEMIGGQRLLLSFLRLGGVANDFPETFEPAARRFLRELPSMIDEYHKVITGNEILQSRIKGIGRLSAEEAVAFGVTGPNLRASGVNYDIRRADPYGVYDRFDFEVPIYSGGDSWARYLVRIDEIIQSARIIEQALDSLPPGEFRSKVPKVIKAPADREVYHHIESAKGELGYHIIARAGEEKPYRLHVRAPSFINLQVLPMLCRGAKFQDLITNIATLDPVLGEADR